ncbi:MULTISPECIES: MBL fold metallo-hydrolase [unclassified Variovorax]|uniref:MBL fold metallo-hydrolase n=1 Tax=unclassified Variovorax TaxID=663243 RepID=UPI0008BB2B79|nr:MULTISPECIES: MBL fold metallo-hydrolase [unclassified Variovorax]SEK16184.1 Glyoxylase, beta-lactamase superfamily II [Variovorax sp. OK202]SFE36276.1 Glyoxylase, beta-lactamase superfamily II [Variovorax sp. OK212]
MTVPSPIAIHCLSSRLVSLLLTAACLLPLSPALAQVKTGYPAERGLKSSDFPRTIRLADGVYGYEDIRAPGFTTVSMFFVGTEGVLLADGQESPQAMRRLLEAIARVSDKPVKWYVFGSDHLDHTGGNALLPKDARLIVHPTSRAQLASDAINAKPDALRVSVPPTAMTSSEETVDIGGREVRVMFLGRAHTGGDLVVYAPKEKILFMSEVYFNRVFPAMRAAFPDEWLSTIDKALQMDVQQFVPGHGFIEAASRSREQLVEFRGAVAYVIAEVTRLKSLGLSIDDAMKEANWGPYTDWMLADSQRLVAIKRMYDQLDERLR